MECINNFNHKLRYEKVVKDDELEVALETIDRIVREERKEQIRKEREIRKTLRAQTDNYKH